MDTDWLIARLAETREPIRPLPGPWVRTAIWLALGLPYVAIVVLVMSPRVDLAAKMGDARFVVEQLASLLTALTAAVAAFETIVPGYGRRGLLLPLLPLAVWLGSVAEGCVRSLMESGSLTLQSDWICFPAIVLVGTVPAIVMAAMLRRGAPLTPHVTTALGGLAAAGLGDFGLRLFHPEDASLMVLVWQVGTVFVLSAVAGCCGGFLLSWRSLIGRLRRKIALG